jgi:hypothetical protein
MWREQSGEKNENHQHEKSFFSENRDKKISRIFSNIVKKYLKMPCPSRDGRISDLKIFEL